MIGKKAVNKNADIMKGTLPICWKAWSYNECIIISTLMYGLETEKLKNELENKLGKTDQWKEQYKG